MSQRMQRITAYGLIFVAWANTVFYWLGNAAANRALSIGDNPLGQSDIFGIVGFLPALIGAVIALALLTYAGLSALNK